MLGMLLYVTIGLVLVLVLRQPMRRLFGATPAFTLWLLPPLMAVLPWLPAPQMHWTAVPGLRVLPAAQTFIAQAAAPASNIHWWWLAWLAGSVLCVLRLAWHYHQMRRDSGRLPAAMLCELQTQEHTLDPRRYCLHSAGPAVLWAPRRSLILLPGDFLQRFDTDQRRLVLQHEHAHLHRGDALWSLLAELALAILWFHPPPRRFCGVGLVDGWQRRCGAGSDIVKVVWRGLPAAGVKVPPLGAWAAETFRAAKASARSMFLSILGP